MKVTSGYRTHSHNIVSGDPLSHHCSGTAADIQFTDGSSAVSLTEHVVDNCVPLFQGYGVSIGVGHYL